MACVALPTCGLAMAESERYLPSLIDKMEVILEDCGLRDDDITIRMTGCPNGMNLFSVFDFLWDDALTLRILGCARPYVAELAFVGKAMGSYNVYLGGGFYGQRLNKLFGESWDEERILRELEPIFKRYASDRLTGEKFGDFAVRSGIVKGVKHGMDFHD